MVYGWRILGRSQFFFFFVVEVNDDWKSFGIPNLLVLILYVIVLKDYYILTLFLFLQLWLYFGLDYTRLHRLQ